MKKYVNKLLYLLLSINLINVIIYLFRLPEIIDLNSLSNYFMGLDFTFEEIRPIITVFVFILAVLSLCISVCLLIGYIHLIIGKNKDNYSLMVTGYTKILVVNCFMILLVLLTNYSWFSRIVLFLILLFILIILYQYIGEKSKKASK